MRNFLFIFMVIAGLSLGSCIHHGHGTTRRTTIIKKDNGQHKGWFKNPNNPHHPNSSNPGKGHNKGPKGDKGHEKGKDHGKGKGKS